MQTKVRKLFALVLTSGRDSEMPPKIWNSKKKVANTKAFKCETIKNVPASN